MSRITSVIISQMYMNIIRAVLSDGIEEILLLQIQMEYIQHQSEIRTIYTIYHI